MTHEFTQNIAKNQLKSIQASPMMAVPSSILEGVDWGLDNSNNWGPIFSLNPASGSNRVLGFLAHSLTAKISATFEAVLEN
jgi:hypothetical protein